MLFSNSSWLVDTLNILHIYKDYFPVVGGIENHVRILAETQVSAGHTVSVIVCNPGRTTQREYLNNVAVLKSGRIGTVASMPLSFTHPFNIMRRKADIVHVHSPYPLGELSAWIFKYHTPTIMTYHSDVVQQKKILYLYGPVLKHILNHVQAIIATSPRYVESSPWLAPFKDKCHVVPLGVDPQVFKPPEDRIAIPPTSNRLLFVGKLRYYKSLDTLLHALVMLPDVTLTIVGDGPMKSKWEDISQKTGIANRVFFLGEMPDADLPAIYHNADLFVLPANSRAEAFGTVLLEAMASGLPCVTTEVGTGTSWLVKNGITGAVVPPDDPVSMAEIIRALLAAPGRLNWMGRNGRARIEAAFTTTMMVNGVMNVYRDILQTSKCLCAPVSGNICGTGHV